MIWKSSIFKHSKNIFKKVKKVVVNVLTHNIVYDIIISQTTKKVVKTLSAR